MSELTLGIGSNVWRYDINRRVYARDANGRASGSCIEREHWERLEITAETSRSWIVTEHGRERFKIPKAKPSESGCVFSEAEIDRRCWAKANCYQIAERVQRLPFDQLAAIADLIGYEPKPPHPKEA